MIKYNQTLNKDIEGQKTTAVVSGGVDDPLTPAVVSASNKTGSSLPSGSYYVGYAWKNGYGLTMISPLASVTTTNAQEISVILPSNPENSETAYIYMGVSISQLKLQGSTSTGQFKKDTAIIEGAAPQLFNNSYEWITPVTIRESIPSGENTIGSIYITDGVDKLGINTDGSLNTVLHNSTGTEIFTQYNPGSVQIRKRSAKEPFKGTTSKTHTFTQNMNGFVISNDGDASIEITIGTYSFDVYPGEVFDEVFDSFNTVVINTTTPYRAYGRG